MFRMYTELADWWPLVSDPADYAEEVDFFMPLIAEFIEYRVASLLELGSGGGNNALHMKGRFTSATLVDVSPQMLAMSRQLNPECEHIEGDMRTVRLERTFNVVFIHDAIDYMLTADDLKKVINTAYLHCRSDGVVLIVPDHVKETFAPSTDHGGEDGIGRSLRYLEWNYDPDPNDTTYTTDYVFVLREQTKPIRIVHDQHTLGLFPMDVWLRLLRETGFSVDVVPDNFGRHLFVARKR